MAWLLAASASAQPAEPRPARQVAPSSEAADAILRKARVLFAPLAPRCGQGEGDEIVVCAQRSERYRVPPEQRAAVSRTEDRSVLLDRRFACANIGASCPSKGLSLITVGSDGKTRVGLPKEDR
jgi:hypothetical protein